MRMRSLIAGMGLALTSACGATEVLDQAVPDVRNPAAIMRTVRALPPDLGAEFTAYVAYARNQDPLLARQNVVTVRDAIEAQRQTKRLHDEEIDRLRREIERAGALTR